MNLKQYIINEAVKWNKVNDESKWKKEVEKKCGSQVKLRFTKSGDDTFAYIGDSSMYVGKYYGTNGYGEVRDTALA